VGRTQVENVRIPLAGKQLSPSVRSWPHADRFAVGVSLSGITALLLLAGLAILIVVPGWVGWFLPAAIVLALLVVAAAAWVNFVGFDIARHEVGIPQALGPEVGGTVVSRLTIRCSECDTIFDVEDPGYRPLYHVCPACGVTGVVEEDAAPAPEPVPATIPPPAPSQTPGPVLAAGAEGIPGEAAAEASARTARGAASVPPPPEPLVQERLKPLGERGAQPTPAGASEEETAFEAIQPSDPYARFRPPREAGAESAGEGGGAAPAPPAKTSGPRGGSKRMVRYTCKSCSTAQTVEDTGERPLLVTCSACGAKARVKLAA
jgi:hypothetical protein